MTTSTPQLPASLRPVSRRGFLLSVLFLLVAPNAVLIGSMWKRLQHEFAPSSVRTCTEVNAQRIWQARVELESGERPGLIPGPCLPAGTIVEKRRWEYGYRLDGRAPFPQQWPILMLANLAILSAIAILVRVRLRRGGGASADAPVRPLVDPSVRVRAQSLPHRVRPNRGSVLLMAIILTLAAIPVGIFAVRFDQVPTMYRLLVVLVFLFAAGLLSLTALVQLYTLTPDALVRFLPMPGRTLHYADLVHAEVHRVRGQPVLALQQRDGRLVELSVGMVELGELLFTLTTLAERAPAIVLGPEALRLREQARHAEPGSSG